MRLKRGDKRVPLPQEARDIYQVVVLMLGRAKQVQQTTMDTIDALRRRSNDSHGEPELYGVNWNVSEPDKQAIEIWPAADCDCEVKVRYTIIKEI